MSAPSPKRARLDGNGYEAAPPVVSAKAALLAAAAREAAECAARDGVPIPAEHEEEEEEEARPRAPPPAPLPQQPRGAPPPPAARPAAAPPRPAPRPAPVPRLEAPAWDAGGRDFKVGPSEQRPAAPALPPLLAALPPGERPVLAPEARGARVPRATRQAALDRLLGAALAAAASAEGQASLLSPARAQHRAMLVAQARAAEEALYTKSASKGVYSNLAAHALRQAAAPPPPEAPKPPSRSAEEISALLARCAVVRGDAAVAAWSEVVAARAHSLSLCWARPFYARRIGEVQRSAALPDSAAAAEADGAEEDAALEAAETSNAAAQPPPPPPPSPPPPPLPPLPPLNVDADVDAMTHRLLHEPLPREPRQAQQPRPLSGLDARIAALSAAHAEPAATDAAEQGARCAAVVRAAVAGACRQFLDPLFRGGALTRDEYRRVARAATDKVCAKHAAARDAAFLEREAHKVHALLREYVKRERSRAGRAADADAGGGEAAELSHAPDDGAHAPPAEALRPA